jgi:hypothetical protein
LADIFISHATKDAKLVDALVRLIEGGVGIRSRQIFCTALEEQGVPAGVDFKTHIKEKLGEAKTVVALISPQYYNSPFCMCELGATWALAKTFVPLLVPPVNYQDLRGSLFGTQALPINQPEKLDSMHSVLVKLATNPEKVSRWNSRKTQFLDELPNILSALKPVKTLSEREADQLTAELNNYKQDFENADKEIATLKKQIAELAKAKDRKAVDNIEKKYSSGLKLFNELLEDARKFTSELPAVVREALYYRSRGDDFLPDWDKWRDEPKGAAEQNLLEADENVFSVNTSHPKIKKVIKALDSLSDFIQELPEDFPIGEYERKYEDLLDMNSRTFWERHRLL